MEESLKENDIWKDAYEAAEEIETGKIKYDTINIEENNEKYDELSFKYDELEKKYQLLKDDFEAKDTQLKRLAADFDNFRRRQSQEKEDLIKYAYEKLFIDLLPVLDNFERAIKYSKDAQEISGILSGVEMIQKQLLEGMSKNGLEIIKALEEQFDPNFHEAVQQIIDDEKEPETVINELQTGYILNGRVIRPSMVIVSKKSDE